MDIYHAWWPELQTIPVCAEVEGAPHWSLRRRPAACFFSLGADSYYTLLKNLDGAVYGTSPTTHLLFVTGFDVRLGNAKLLQAVADNLAKAERATATTVLHIETNLRQLTDPIVPWNLFHGSAMASVGIALERAFEAIHIASSCSYDDLFPWGSHPLTDPLWSTTRLRLIHDGCEFTRAQKIANIARVPVVQETLRTCWENRQNRYNCGECDKCLRTMAVLHTEGVLEAMTTYPDSFPIEALANVKWSEPRVRRRFQSVLDALSDRPSDQPLRAVVEGYLREFGAPDEHATTT